MSDPSSPHGTTTPSPPAGPGSWTPPPPSPAPRAPSTTPPSSDTTGGLPVTTKPRGSVNIDLSLGLVFAVLGLIGIVLAVLLKETDENYWDNIGVLWSLAAIAAAVLTLVPSLRSVVNLDEKLSWRIGAAGAAFLVFWWVVFVLPTIGVGSPFKNLPFLATIAVAFATIAVWTSPGNPYHSTDASTTP